MNAVFWIAVTVFMIVTIISFCRSSKRKRIKWSCEVCSANGVIKYTLPGNPYKIGLAAEEMHLGISPSCGNRHLNFDPRYVARKYSLRPSL